MQALVQTLCKVRAETFVCKKGHNSHNPFHNIHFYLSLSEGFVTMLVPSNILPQ